jgi:protein O-GlcNAc transferase
MNREERRGAGKLGQMPSGPAVETGTAAVPPGDADLFSVGRRHHQAGRLSEAEACYRRVLAAQPDHADALHLLGIIAHQAGRHDLAVGLIGQAIKQNGQNAAYFDSLGIALKHQGKLDEAVTAYRQAIRIKPDLAEAHCNLGNALRDQGKLDEAVASYRQAIRLKPGLAEARCNLGNALRGQRKLDEALASYDHAFTLRPDYADALYNRGNVLRELKRLDEALASYDRALTLRSDHAEALSNRGNVLRELNRLDEALASHDRALTLRPEYADVLFNRGNALQELKWLDEALESYDRALTLRPDHAEAHYNRGNVLRELNRRDDALASYDRALSVRPDYADALFNRGNVLYELKRLDEALASYDRGLSVRPDYAEALNNRGNVLRELKRRYDEALASYDRALTLQPGHAGTLNNRGVTLHESNRFDEALASYDCALAVKADHVHAFSGAADCVMKLCDWDRRMRFAAEITAHVSGKRSIVAPFVLLGYSDDPALQLQCARNYIENKFPSPLPPFWSGQTWRDDKLRVAYLSPDFRSHPVAFLMAELFEQHDRSRFEIIGISFGVDDRSETRKRLIAAFDEFHDVRRKNDKETAKILNDRRFDIAVDLAGYTQDSRPGIFAHRPAPIQVNYLGFPGTMGADFIDYIIADAMVVPVEHQPFYTEKIVYLPDCFQANDTKRKIAEHTPTRQEMGLPEHAFVFCCFNNSWKIAPEIFNIWMRLLHQVEGSVLWLLGTNARAEQNLRTEAQRRGIDPSRLVFARPLPLAEHLARQRLAGLFLDTVPYNAGATAAAALWSGLPVLTVIGEAFVGRMAASLLQAVGIPELITANLEDYQTLALKLARDPAWLADTKAKLPGHRNTCPLFDTVRFARHIESAYRTMWEIWQRGEAPKSFSVEPIVLAGFARGTPAE